MNIRIKKDCEVIKTSAGLLKDYVGTKQDLYYYNRSEAYIGAFVLAENLFVKQGDWVDLDSYAFAYKERDEHVYFDDEGLCFVLSDEWLTTKDFLCSYFNASKPAEKERQLRIRKGAEPFWVDTAYNLPVIDDKEYRVLKSFRINTEEYCNVLDIWDGKTKRLFFKQEDWIDLTEYEHITKDIYILKYIHWKKHIKPGCVSLQDYEPLSSFIPSAADTEDNLTTAVHKWLDFLDEKAAPCTQKVYHRGPLEVIMEKIKQDLQHKRTLSEKEKQDRDKTSRRKIGSMWYSPGYGIKLLDFQLTPGWEPTVKETIEENLGHLKNRQIEKDVPFWWSLGVNTITPVSCFNLPKPAEKLSKEKEEEYRKVIHDTLDKIIYNLTHSFLLGAKCSEKPEESDKGSKEIEDPHVKEAIKQLKKEKTP